MAIQNMFLFQTTGLVHEHLIQLASNSPYRNKVERTETFLLQI